MRGEDRTSGALFSCVDVEARLPAKHPLRAMRRLTNAALAELDQAFSGLYEGSAVPLEQDEFKSNPSDHWATCGSSPSYSVMAVLRTLDRCVASFFLMTLAVQLGCVMLQSPISRFLFQSTCLLYNLTEVIRRSGASRV